jgi:hypothetical protein
MFKGDRLQGTLLDTALFGALFVLCCDLIGRILVAPYELPIELITGVLGSVIFIGLMIYRLKAPRRKISLANTASCSAAPACVGGANESKERK